MHSILQNNLCIQFKAQLEGSMFEFQLKKKCFDVGEIIRIPYQETVQVHYTISQDLNIQILIEKRNADKEKTSSN